MIIQPQFPLFLMVFLPLLSPLLAKSLMSKLSAFERPLKSRKSSSSSFKFPKNWFDLVSLSIFLMPGHFFNSKTCKNFFISQEKCTSVHSTNGKVHSQSTPEKGTSGSTGATWRVHSQRLQPSLFLLVLRL